MFSLSVAIFPYFMIWSSLMRKQVAKLKKKIKKKKAVNSHLHKLRYTSVHDEWEMAITTVFHIHSILCKTNP